jgi:hypothetical protein
MKIGRGGVTQPATETDVPNWLVAAVVCLIAALIWMGL